MTGPDEPEGPGPTPGPAQPSDPDSLSPPDPASRELSTPLPAPAPDDDGATGDQGADGLGALVANAGTNEVGSEAAKRAVEGRDREAIADSGNSEVKRSTAKRAVEGRPRAGLMSSEELRDQMNRQALEAREQILQLRQRYAKYLLRVLIAQLVLADIVFVVYGFANGWDLGPAAIEVWLTATVVEVIGLTVVIVKYLFSDQPPV